MSQLKTLSITGIKEQSTNSVSHNSQISLISHRLSLYSKKVRSNLNLSFNNSYRDIVQSKAFLEDSPQIKRSHSHKKRILKVDIGNIVNEELDEESSGEQKENESIEIKKKEIFYEEEDLKNNDNNQITENEFNQFLSRFEDEEELIFDDEFNCNLDSISIEDFTIEDNNHNLLNQNNFGTLVQQFEDIEKIKKCSDNNVNINNINNNNFQRVPTILQKIIQHEQIADFSSGEKSFNTNKNILDNIFCSDSKENSTFKGSGFDDNKDS